MRKIDIFFIKKVIKEELRKVIKENYNLPNETKILNIVQQLKDNKEKYMDLSQHFGTHFIRIHVNGDVEMHSKKGIKLLYNVFDEI